MGVNEFKQALAILNPSKLESLELDLESQCGAYSQCEEGLSRCGSLTRLSVFRATTGATRLLLVCSRSLAVFHFEGAQSLIGFYVPCMCSSIRHLSLARVFVSERRLEVLAPLESLTLVGCTLRAGSLPLTLGLKSLTAHDNHGFFQDQLLRVCKDLEHLDIRGRDLSLSASYLCELVSVAPKLRFLTAVFPADGDCGILASDLKKIRPTLEVVELY
jgi:hypothetical protein